MPSLSYGIWDQHAASTFPNRDRTQPPCKGAQSLSHQGSPYPYVADLQNIYLPFTSECDICCGLFRYYCYYVKDIPSIPN